MPPQDRYDWHKSPIVDNVFKLLQVVIIPAVGWYYIQMWELTVAQRALAAEVEKIAEKVVELRAETVRKDVQVEVDKRQDNVIEELKQEKKINDKVNARS